MKPCKRGHTEGRYKSGGCKACTRASSVRKRAKNPGRYWKASADYFDDSIESRPVIADVCCEDLMLLTEFGGMQ